MEELCVYDGTCFSKALRARSLTMVTFTYFLKTLRGPVKDSESSEFWKIHDEATHVSQHGWVGVVGFRVMWV